MKRFLKKRWLGLPVGIITVVLLVCLLAGGTLAATGAFRVFTSDVEITVHEPLEVTEIQEPGWFWDWHTPEVPAVQQEIYAGLDLGLEGWGGKYLIHNISPQPIQITVTVSESTGQTNWYGLRGCYSTTGHTGHDTCNYEVPIVDMNTNEPCWTNPGEVHSCTFDLGAVDYVWYAGMPGSEVGTDSSSVMFFVEAEVADNATLVDPLIFTLTVDRGE